MPNRILKESICTSDEINNLTDAQECFFFRLLVNCDDFGLLDARPQILASKCYPLKSIDSKRIQQMLDALCAVGLAFLYEIDGKPYLKIVNWEKHQQIRAKRPKYPLPDINCNQVVANVPVIQSNPIRKRSASASRCLHGFDEFWTAYPRKVGKGAAEKAFAKANVNGCLPDVLKAIDRQRQSEQWQKDGGQFIPNPATWLNQRRWEDGEPQAKRDWI